jgi:hypothetical protein
MVGADVQPDRLVHALDRLRVVLLRVRLLLGQGSDG